MFKYLLVLVLAVALIEARPGKKGHHKSGGKSGSGSGSESYEVSSEGPAKAADFHDELQNVKNTAVEMAGAIDSVKNLAEKALAHPEGEGWEEFGAAMEKTLVEVGQRFGGEVHRVAKLAEALWFDQTDLQKDDKCGFVAHVDEHKEELDNVELEWALAMIQDLACMSGEFQAAENIPFDELKGDVHEDTAIHIVQSVLWEMHKISRAGEVFGKSMHNIAEYLGATSSGEESSESYESSTAGSSGSAESSTVGSDSAESGSDSAESSTVGPDSAESSTAGSDSAESSTDSAESSTVGPDSAESSTAGSDSAESTDSAEVTTVAMQGKTTYFSSAEKRTLYRLTRFLKRFSNK